MRCMCRNPDIVSDYERGEMVCGRCGVVLERMMEAALAPLVAVTQTRSSKNVDDLGTYQIFTHADLRKMGVVNGGVNHANRADKAKKTAKIEVQINQLMDGFGAKDVVRREAVRIFHKCHEARLDALKKNTLVSAACVSLACKLHGTVIREDMLVKYSNVRRMYFRKYTREVHMHLGLPQVSIEDRVKLMLTNISASMNLPVPITRRAFSLFEKVRTADRTFVSNPHTAAMTLLFICNPKATLAGYARHGCTNTSIRCNREKYLKFMKRHGITP